MDKIKTPVILKDFRIIKVTDLETQQQYGRTFAPYTGPIQFKDAPVSRNLTRELQARIEQSCQGCSTTERQFVLKGHKVTCPKHVHKSLAKDIETEIWFTRKVLNNNRFKWLISKIKIPNESKKIKMEKLQEKQQQCSLGQYCQTAEKYGKHDKLVIPCQLCPELYRPVNDVNTQFYHIGCIKGKAGLICEFCAHRTFNLTWAGLEEVSNDECMQWSPFAQIFGQHCIKCRCFYRQIDSHLEICDDSGNINGHTEAPLTEYYAIPQVQLVGFRRQIAQPQIQAQQPLNQIEQNQPEQNQIEQNQPEQNQHGQNQPEQNQPQQNQPQQQQEDVNHQVQDQQNDDDQELEIPNLENLNLDVNQQDQQNDNQDEFAQEPDQNVHAEDGQDQVNNDDNQDGIQVQVLLNQLAQQIQIQEEANAPEEEVFQGNPEQQHQDQINADFNNLPNENQNINNGDQNGQNNDNVNQAPQNQNVNQLDIEQNNNESQDDSLVHDIENQLQEAEAQGQQNVPVQQPQQNPQLPNLIPPNQIQVLNLQIPAINLDINQTSQKNPLENDNINDQMKTNVNTNLLKNQKSKKKKKKKKKKNQGSCNVSNEKNLFGKESDDSDDDTKGFNLGKRSKTNVRRSRRLSKKQKSHERIPHKSQSQMVNDDFAEEEKEDEFVTIPEKKAWKPDPVYSIDLETENSKSTLVDDLSSKQWNQKEFLKLLTPKPERKNKFK